MEKNLDKIAEAFFGDLGPLMAQKTRNRVQWIMKNVKGNNVLDIGCSQGLIPILLGREGRHVTGVDISKESIHYAIKLLQRESEIVLKNVSFINGDFLHEDLQHSYDCVLITEVLEHLYDSHSFVEKAYSLLKPEGRIIITVPFGINDYPDHKRTLYTLEIYRDLYPFFDITNISFLGKWIGFTGRKLKKTRTIEDLQVSMELAERTEEAFYKIERELTNQAVKQKQQIHKLREQNEGLRQELESMQVHGEKAGNENELLKVKISSLERQLREQQAWSEKRDEEYEKHIQAKDERIADLKEQAEEKKRQIEIMNEQLEKQIRLLADLSEKGAEPSRLINEMKHNFKHQVSAITEEIKKNRENGEALARHIVESLHSESRVISAEIENKLTSVSDAKSKFEVKMKKKQSEITKKLDHALEELRRSNQMVSGLSGNLEETLRENKHGFHTLQDFLRTQMELASNSEKEMYSSIGNAVQQSIEEQRRLREKVEQAVRKEEEQTKLKNNEVLAIKEANQSIQEKLHAEKAKLAEIQRKYEADVSALNEEYSKALKEKQRNEEVLQKALHENEQLSGEIAFLQENYQIDMAKAKEEVLFELQQCEQTIKQLLEERAKYEYLNKRYKAIKNSKLGKVTVRYWSFKNKIKANSHKQSANHSAERSV
ncbi:methyltransferase domain-containing protein [Cytobacillus sp.]|uniref:methyltransferase domain-containing protein n=1 Tax=Cytobacillus sp. TaxID=2675269 RepID=UPI0035111687